MVKRGASETRRRVILPTLMAVAGGLLIFPLMHVTWRNILLRKLIGDGVSVLTDSLNVEIVYNSFVSNYLSIFGLLFSILGGSSYSSLYGQNEAIYMAIFAEVSEAKALVEQLVLVCQGRPICGTVLGYMERYVRDDLRALDTPPAVSLALRPRDDPLESILYTTSVGVPSSVYETVRSLRQLRGQRLGAIQRKLPPIQIALLYVLGIGLAMGFPMISAEVDGAGVSPILRIIFGLMCGSIAMTLRVIHELWTPFGGAYNVDGVLEIALQGLEEELKLRREGKTFSRTTLPSPPPKWKSSSSISTAATSGAPERGGGGVGGAVA